ncbi:MAG TPA: hypothetical protein VGZ22_26930 [Isosphaeraceae bacterium]|nr:hypothetical protein [Isosphaeraceae bacterium]
MRLVWYVDPKPRIVRVFTSLDHEESFGEDRILEGGELLPGFALSIRDFFAQADRSASGT